AMMRTNWTSTGNSRCSTSSLRSDSMASGEALARSGFIRRDSRDREERGANSGAERAPSGYRLDGTALQHYSQGLKPLAITVQRPRRADCESSQSAARADDPFGVRKPM